MAEISQNLSPNSDANLNLPKIDVPAPVPEPVNNQSQNPVLIAVIIGLIVAIICTISAAVVISKSKTKTTVILITPTPPYLSPTPIRAQNPVATTSAFMDLDQKLTKLNNNLNQLSVQDTNLYPPVLDLPLGFSN